MIEKKIKNYLIAVIHNACRLHVIAYYQFIIEQLNDC